MFKFNKSGGHSFLTDLQNLSDIKLEDDNFNYKMKLGRRLVPEDTHKFPFINNCKQDITGDMLKFLYPEIKTKHSTTSYQELISKLG